MCITQLSSIFLRRHNTEKRHQASAVINHDKLHLKMTQKTILSFLLFTAVLIFSNCNYLDSSNDQLKKTEHTQLNSESNLTTNFEGTYQYGTDIENGPVGRVTIYQSNDSSALFYLDICRGAPSYNLGQILGELSIEGNKGIYNEDCSLLFEFHDDQLKIQTDDKNSECGFGHAVYADNSYKLINRTKPKFFIDGQGDTIYFEGLTVENYYNFE